MSLEIRPIAELTAEHQGRVILIDISQWARCEGQMARPWGADEKAGVLGTDNPEHIKFFFSHFALLSEIEAAERERMLSRYGSIVPGEEQLLAQKYGRTP